MQRYQPFVLIGKFPKTGQHFVAQHNFAERVEAVALRSIFIDHHGTLLCITAANGQCRLLCLNYDGKFGLNNMNNYFQNANKKGEAISWREWTYKVGDPILFNETKRFPLLYNNLKGRIVGIVKDAESVTFTIDIEVILTEMDCQGQDFELVDVFDNSSRISLTVYAYDDNTSDLEDSSRMNSIVPFQLAYAVSIHKAQGLEYDSVKVIIPQSNSEKITHGIFYTAITRAKKKLKIYWSAETMKEIVSGFATNESNGKSLEIVKAKLAVTQ